MKTRLLLIAILVQCAVDAHKEGKPPRDVTCNYKKDDRGYVCEVENLKLSDIDDRVRFTGTQLPGKTNEDVEYLQIKSSECNVVPSEDIMYYLTNLKKLEMKGVAVTKVDPIVNCMPLHFIDFSGNQIKRIDAGVFIECESLEILDLSRNILKRIHDNAFSSLNALVELDLSSNNLDKLYRKILKPLKKLKKLSLNTNKIVDLPADLFNDLFQLVELDLSNNPLNRLDFRTFDFTIHIEVLRLKNSNLIKLHQFVLKNLRRLRFLDLSDNDLMHIGGQLLSTNTQIEELHMNQIRLNDMGRHFFDKLDKLKAFEAKGNKCVDGVFVGDVVAIRSKFLKCFENLDIRVERSRSEGHSGDEL